jgi:ferredoxin-NADP reductase
VVHVVRETHAAVSLVLEDPTGGLICFLPGQFFTFLVPIGDQILRRAYSASSDARDQRCVSVTIKRIPGGLVSNHLNDFVRVDDLVQVLGPAGSFGVAPDASLARELVLIAGGSGITPMMSIARTVLAVELQTRVTLVYGNRALRDIIFRDALEALASEHHLRLTVRHVLSVPPADWRGGTGLLDARVLDRELDACAARGDSTFLLCGPEAMMREARTTLQERGVDSRRILEERYGTPQHRTRAPLAAVGPQLLTIQARDEASSREVYVGGEQTVLEAGLSAGVSMDYSCAMGGCGVCKVRLVEGEVVMEEPNCLTGQERSDGYVLACVARLRTAATVTTAGAPDFAARQVGL